MVSEKRPVTPGACLGCGRPARWHCSNAQCWYAVCDNQDCRLVREQTSTGRGFVRGSGVYIYHPDKTVPTTAMPREPHELINLKLDDDGDATQEE